jgi:pyruvate,orthophosphate dikinase
MQDIEFTIERGKLWMLQTRTGKRTGAAAVKVACDMVKEKLITEEQALLRIPAGDLTQLLLPFDSTPRRRASPKCSRGLPASPGGGGGSPGVHRRRSGRADARGREGDPGPSRDEPRGRRGHALGGGHPHEHGRDDEPRGGRGPRVGQVLRRGRGRRRDRPGEGRVRGRRARRSGATTLISIDGSTGEVMRARSRRPSRRSRAISPR